MGYLPYLGLELELDLEQSHGELKRLLRELKYTRKKDLKVSEKGRRRLILIAQTAEQCAEEIWVITGVRRK